MVLNILFFILKLIGILLLAVLALLLLLIIALLAVPIRYTARLEHGECLIADIRINWLLHLLNARLSYKEEKLHIRVRLAFLTLYDSLRPKRGKKSGQADTPKKKGRMFSAFKKEKEKTGSNLARSSGSDAEENGPESGKSIKPTGIDTQKEAIISDSYKKTTYTDNRSKKGKKAAAGKQAKVKAGAALEKDKSIFSRIRKKINSAVERVRTYFIALWNKFVRIFQTASDIREKIKLIIDFLQDTQNREGIRLTFTESKKILKHILPGKLKSTIRFGTGDPCSTGQALGAFGIFYSFYGDNINITPDFENKVFEGKHYAKGRISLIIIIYIIIRLIRDKRFKSLKKNFLLLKEAL